MKNVISKLKVLKIGVVILLFLIPNHSKLSAQTQIGQDIDGEVVNDWSGYSVSLTADGTRVTIGAVQNSDSEYNAGHVRVFDEIGGAWVQVGQDIDGGAYNAHSGHSVSISANGTRVAIGAPLHGGNLFVEGRVRIYELNGNGWTQIGSDIIGVADNDHFGNAISLSADGNRVVIGALRSGDDQGQVRVFELNTGNWLQVGSNIDGDGAYDLFGQAVSISADGSIIAIGAHQHNSFTDGSGQVKVYQEVGGVWIQIGSDIYGEYPYDGSGYSVSLSSDGSRVAIGAIYNEISTTRTGHVRIYEEENGAWTQVGGDIDGEAAQDEFGSTVSLTSDGMTVAIGAPRNDGSGNNAGHVRIYRECAGEWVQLGIDIDGEAAIDNSGSAISLSSDGSRVAIGAYANSGGTTVGNAGHVRVFELEPNCPLAGIYVDHTAQGNNDGASWTDAFTDLQDALATGSDANIFIAAGTYKPTTSGRGISFEIPNNSNLIGGFPNGGGEKDPEANVVILSGDIDNDQTWAGNSFHVVKAINITATIEGITIQDGNADNANSFGRSRGGGLFLNNADLVLGNSFVTNNYALFGGGLFATLSPNVTLVDCQFDNNQANNGSALYHSNMTNMYIDRTRIVDNNSLIRCAIEVNNSLYTKIENSVIANNASANANAIAYIATNRDQSSDIINSTILGAANNKQLITFQIGFNDQLDINMYNSIIAHQYLNFDKNVKAFSNGTFNFYHHNCYFQGETVIGAAVNVLMSDADGDLMLNNDYSVMPCSPVVNTGANVWTTASMDINGAERIFNNIVDRGAYESQGACRLGLRENENNEMLDDTVIIFPNPTKGNVSLHSEKEIRFVEVFDVNGRQIIFTENQEFSLSSYPNGIYLARIQMLDGSQVYKKVFKN